MGPQEFGTWIGIGFAALGATFAAYKKWSRDGTDIASNREEKNWVVRAGKEIEAERKRADEAIAREREVWQMHIADSDKIARLQAKCDTCETVTAALEKRLGDLQRIVWSIADDNQRKILGSEFGEMRKA